MKKQITTAKRIMLIWKQFRREQLWHSKARYADRLSQWFAFYRSMTAV